MIFAYVHVKDCRVWLGLDVQVRYGKTRDLAGAQSYLLQYCCIGNIAEPEIRIFLLLGCAVLCATKNIPYIGCDSTSRQVPTNFVSVLEFFHASVGDCFVFSALQCGCGYYFTGEN